ncbi:MAG: hypothetical protein WC378_00995 [Opitutaceae bacterium]|jgi:hypothetical protein
MKAIKMAGVRQYLSGYPVCLEEFNGRLVIAAACSSGSDGTWVDLKDLIAWVKTNRPDLLDPTSGS